MRKKSTLLIVNTLIILTLLSISTGYTTFLVDHMEGDAKTINDLRIIRGSIQRIVKQELAKTPNDDLIQSTDDFIIATKDNLSGSELSNLIYDINLLWIKLKEDINLYRM